MGFRSRVESNNEPAGSSGAVNASAERHDDEDGQNSSSIKGLTSIFTGNAENGMSAKELKSRRHRRFLRQVEKFYSAIDGQPAAAPVRTIKSLPGLPLGLIWARHRPSDCHDVYIGARQITPEREFAMSIQKGLEQRGLTVFMRQDEDYITPQDKWFKGAMQQLCACRVAVLIDTQHTIRRTEELLEAEAFTPGRYFDPVVAEWFMAALLKAAGRIDDIVIVRANAQWNLPIHMDVHGQGGSTSHGRDSGGRMAASPAVSRAASKFRGKNVEFEFSSHSHGHVRVPDRTQSPGEDSVDSDQSTLRVLRSTTLSPLTKDFPSPSRRAGYVTSPKASASSSLRSITDKSQKKKPNFQTGKPQILQDDSRNGASSGRPGSTVSLTVPSNFQKMGTALQVGLAELYETRTWPPWRRKSTGTQGSVWPGRVVGEGLGKLSVEKMLMFRSTVPQKQVVHLDGSDLQHAISMAVDKISSRCESVFGLITSGLSCFCRPKVKAA